MPSKYKKVFLTETKLRDLLKSMSVDIIDETSTDLLGYCPFHSNRDSPAFNISKSAPYLWKCWNGSCSATGNIFTLLTQKGYTLGEAERMILAGVIESDDFVRMVEELLSEAQEEENQWKDIDWNQFTTGDSDNDYPARTYVLDRGITLDAYLYFGLGYSRTKHRVVIPVRDIQGTLIGLIGRSIQNKDYQYSKSLKRHRTIWNLHNVLWLPFDSIVLTEGAFDSISLWDAGIKNVGAIFGSSLSEEQADLIRGNFYEVVCFFDNDQAGYAATDQVISMFPTLEVSYVEYPSRMVELPDGTQRPVKDPGELSINEMQDMYKNRKSKYNKLWS